MNGGKTMKVYIMTDMEGVCGILNHDEWVIHSGRFYDKGQRLLTMEVNAAVEGFFAAGADEIYVSDGHGAGGINQLLLDKRTSLIRGFLPDLYPYMLDSSFDAIAWIGQHAKAGAEYAHLPHTGWFDVLDYTINGISMGEFGLLATCALFLGVTPVFGSGDEAFTREARTLFPEITTVAVKKGMLPGKGDECDTKEYIERNSAAIHIHPLKARELIREGSEKALRSIGEKRKTLADIGLNAPFIKKIRYRKDSGAGNAERSSGHPESPINAINK